MKQQPMKQIHLPPPMTNFEIDEVVSILMGVKPKPNPKSPRRMDLYMFLCHRTPRIAERKTVHIPLRAIQRIFAPDITRPRDFKTRLRNDMKAIANVYPHFKAEIKGDMLALRKSPPPTPPRPTVTVPRIRT